MKSFAAPPAVPQLIHTKNQGEREIGRIRLPKQSRNILAHPSPSRRRTAAKGRGSSAADRRRGRTPTGASRRRPGRRITPRTTTTTTIRRTCLPRRRRRRSASIRRRPKNPRTSTIARRRSSGAATTSAVSGPTGITGTMIAETDITAATADGTSPRAPSRRLGAGITATAAVIGITKRLPVSASASASAKPLLQKLRAASTRTDTARIPPPPSRGWSTSSPRPLRPTPSSRTRPPSRTRRSSFVSFILAGRIGTF